MTEHWFLAIMLAVVGLEVLVVAFLTYRAYRMSQRIEAIGAATFLEVRRILSLPG